MPDNDAFKTFPALSGYTFSVSTRKPNRKLNEDLRDFATYTIPEAALFLGIPQRTLAEWFSSPGGLLRASVSGRGGQLLSFIDTVEAYAIFLLRSHHHLTMQSIRRALIELPLHTKEKHPLVSENLKVFEDFLLYDRPADGTNARHVINLSENGQLVIPHVVDIFASRVHRNSDGKTVAMFPWRFWENDQDSKPVQLDPAVMSGRLVLTGTRIPVRMILDRHQRGQSAGQIADDYGLPVESVEKALQHIDKKAA